MQASLPLYLFALFNDTCLGHVLRHLSVLSHMNESFIKLILTINLNQDHQPKMSFPTYIPFVAYFPFCRESLCHKH